VTAGLNIELIQPVWGQDGPAAVWGNKTFYYLGETGSELTDFRVKSSWPKTSILVPRVALWEVQLLMDQLVMGSLWRTFLYHMAHPTNEGLGSNTQAYIYIFIFGILIHF
jgi:hypothetical protein